SEGNLTLQGSARDNETVAEFMVNLERSPIVISVDLQSSKSTTVQGVSLSDFSLKCKVDPSGKSKEIKKGG
ncbi:MAG: PilN domain-containing protein, partial [Deltaproteobacteria bacterium]|nr:PilN domain-containing protein [Deltaproteobacteria bacterium]